MNSGVATATRFGARAQVDPIEHLLYTAAGWGGNPREAAVYVSVVPKANDGKTVHRLTVGEVPVDGFWSISVYNARGFFEKNALDSYSLNNLTAKPNKDGSITVQFGGCSAQSVNCLVTPAGWNYVVRLYRPRRPILDDTWKFPLATPVSDRHHGRASQEEVFDHRHGAARLILSLSRRRAAPRNRAGAVPRPACHDARPGFRWYPRERFRLNRSVA